jgi:O-antigen/teichoic acid export membrane protein
LAQAVRDRSPDAAPTSTPALSSSKTPVTEAGDRVSLDERRKTWAIVRRTLCDPHVLALADQAVVSATSFLTTIAVGRATSASELGVYALGMSVLIAFANVQESLVSLPYTIQRFRPEGAPGEHAGSSLMLGGLLSALAISTLGATAAGIPVIDAKSELTTTVWVLAAVAPFVMLREFGRRFAFAHLRVADALVLDVTVAAMQLSVLCWLGWIGWMSAPTALAAIGAGCGLAGITWLYVGQHNFAFRRCLVWGAARRSWNLGKWLLANQLILVVQRQITYWMLIGIAGTTATGIFAACMSIGDLASPLMQGLSNSLWAKAALALKEGGGGALRREAFHETLLLGAPLIVFCATILVAGEYLMQLLCPGQDYGGRGDIVTVLALAQLSFAIGIPPYNALSITEHTSVNFWIGLVGTALTMVLVWALVVEWGVLGAAYGILAGNTGRSVVRWAVFWRIVPRSQLTGDPWRVARRWQSVNRRLRQFVRSCEYGSRFVPHRGRRKSQNEGATARAAFLCNSNARRD